MKTSSWEIIIAGFIFVGISIYIIEQNSDAPAPDQKAEITDNIRNNLAEKNVRLVQLESLKRLEKLEQLENLENLESLNNLRNLKNLTNFLPEEIRADFESEIDEVINEFEQESVEVKIDTEKGTLSINSAVSVSPGGWTAVSPGVFSYAREFDASQLKDAELSLPFGSIEIIGTSESKGTLSIEASGEVSTRSELESKIKTTSDIGPQTTRFSITTGESATENPNIQLHATLTLPSDIELTSTTKAGHISSNKINGKQSYSTLGGHISLREVTGDIDASTNGGHISVKNSKGSLNLQSKGGHIVTASSEGTIIMNTSGGNLKATDIQGAVQASTNGGNVELSFLKLDGKSTANTGAGTIILMIPSTANANLDLSGNSVEIASEFNFQGNHSTGSAKGSIGNGGNAVVAKTNYGKVLLKAQD